MFPSGGPREESVSSLFSACCETSHSPWLLTPLSSVFRASDVASLWPFFHSHISCRLTPSGNGSLILKIRVIRSGVPLEIYRLTSLSRSVVSATFLKFFVQCELKDSEVPEELGCGHLWGTIISSFLLSQNYCGLVSCSFYVFSWINKIPPFLES